MVKISVFLKEYGGSRVIFIFYTKLVFTRNLSFLFSTRYTSFFFFLQKNLSYWFEKIGGNFCTKNCVEQSVSANFIGVPVRLFFSDQINKLKES